MTQRERQGGCFKTLRMFWTIIFFFSTLLLTGVNLFFSNIFGETCGYIHPYIFEIEVSVIDSNGLMIAEKDSIPFEDNEDVVLYREIGWLTSATGGTLDTYLRVYDASGENLLASNDDSPNGGLDSEIISFSISDDQQIIIEVGTFADSSEGEFELTIFDDGATSDVTAFNEPADGFFDEIIDGGQIDNSNLSDGIVIEGDVFLNSRVQYRLDAEGGRDYYFAVSGSQGFLSDTLTATNWTACLQYFGFVSDNGFVINANGYNWFVSDGLAGKADESCTVEEDSFRAFLEQCVRATVSVSATGRVIFFVLLAIIVVSLPIFIVDALEGQRETVWYLFLFLVAVQATTTAMLFLHLGNVSGIDALSEFGYSIFGGITTGSALVFIDKLASRAEDGTSMINPPDDERLL